MNEGFDPQADALQNDFQPNSVRRPPVESVTPEPGNGHNDETGEETDA